MTKLNKILEKNYNFVRYFVNTPSSFDNSKAQQLAENLSKNDQKEFSFDMRTINWRECIDSYVLGSKRFLLKENCSEEAIRKGQLKMKR